MLAAILLRPERLEVGDVPKPPCPEGGVLINIRACGICAADAKMVAKGHPSLVYPRIPGHEISGIVAESRSKLFQPGDRVQVAPGLRCDNCRACRNGSDNLCENRQIYGFTRDGGFSQYVSVPLNGPLKGALNLLPENVSFADATLAEPIACCINAQDRLKIKQGDTVLIVGAGPLGLLHAYVAEQNNAGKIIVSEGLPHRRKICSEIFACGVVDPTRHGLFEAVMNETREKGVDAVILACSQKGLDDELVKLLKPGGGISVFSGTAPPQAQIQLDANRIHYNEIRITGAYGCTAAQNRRAIRLLASGRISAGALISGRFALEDIKKGLARTQSRSGIKFIVEECNGQ